MAFCTGNQIRKDQLGDRLNIWFLTTLFQPHRSCSLVVEWDGKKVMKGVSKYLEKGAVAYWRWCSPFDGETGEIQKSTKSGYPVTWARFEPVTFRIEITATPTISAVLRENDWQMTLKCLFGKYFSGMWISWGQAPIGCCGHDDEASDSMIAKNCFTSGINICCSIRPVVLCRRVSRSVRLHLLCFRSHPSWFNNLLIAGKEAPRYVIISVSLILHLTSFCSQSHNICYQIWRLDPIDSMLFSLW